MAVNLKLAPALPVDGVALATVSAGVKADGSSDMVLCQLAPGSTSAAVFTSNTFCAAPVTICRQHMSASQGAVRALLVNSGNANAGTGEPGLSMAMGHCQALAQAMNIPVESVLPFSTGVIGQLLPDEKMLAGIQLATRSLASVKQDVTAWQAAADGIMTTDTQPKLTSRTVTLSGTRLTITGMAKGAGMIQPDMATMLSYVFTDAKIDRSSLDAALREAVEISFNAITVDSDTSTNDACVLSATGASGLSLSTGSSDWQAFVDTLKEVFLDLAQAIIRDAEGASKFISVNVAGGADSAECKQVAYAIANSPLVKTAMFASDANVGRLLMAIGKAGVKDLDAFKVKVSLGDVLAFEAGGIASGYTEEKGSAAMAEADIAVVVDLGRGAAAASVYTSDLSHDYVSINADYRS